MALASAAVTSVQQAVTRRGFRQHPFNEPADMPAHVLSGLQEMGATEYVDLVGRAISVFPGGTLLGTHTERMSLLPDDPYEEVSSEHTVMLEILDEPNDRLFDLYGEAEGFYKYIACAPSSSEKRVGDRRRVQRARLLRPPPFAARRMGDRSTLQFLQVGPSV
jgi:hypothetical protein